MYKLTRLTPEMEREYQDYIEKWRHSGEMIVPMSSDHQELTYTVFEQSACV